MDNLRLLYALTALNSYFYNPRRTEDFTHPLWAEIMAHLCRASPSLLPTPQFRLYVSPRDFDLPTDANFSFSTQSDSEAKGVITDFCVLIPNLTHAEGGTPNVLDVENVRQHIKDLNEGDIPFPKFLVKNMFVGALVELKCPLSRHFPNVKAYARRKGIVLHAAKIQVTAQAQCLFSSSKYASQKYVMLIAAVGEWWTMKVAKREDFDVFVLGAYDNLVSNANEVERDDDDEIRILDENDWDNDFHDPKTVHSISEETLALVKADALEDIRREAKKARQEEEMKRLKPATPAVDNDPKEELKEFLTTASSQFCTEETINELYRLQSKCSGKYPFYHREVGTIPTGKVTKNSLTTWCNPMRIGSTASNTHFDFIQKELKAAVFNHRY
ncbi:hypothetical protein BDQ17DRAFT_1411686 [Cyathus striatus]|nr:hypothetical protein BDQ17DRAFT_1411686 [Cyathus striatus]